MCGLWFLSLLQDKGGPSLQRSNSSGPSPSAPSSVSLPGHSQSSSSSSHPPTAQPAHVAAIPNGPVHPSTTSPNNVIRPQLPIRMWNSVVYKFEQLSILTYMYVLLHAELPPGSHPAALHPALRPPTSFPSPFPTAPFLPSPFPSVDIHALQQFPSKPIIPLSMSDKWCEINNITIIPVMVMHQYTKYHKPRYTQCSSFFYKCKFYLHEHLFCGW